MIFYTFTLTCMQARMHARMRKVHQNTMTSMYGYWIVIVITATTKSRTLATVCMLTEHYDYLLAYISALIRFKNVFKFITPEACNCVR